MESTILYSETQKFTQWWLWLFLGGVGFFTLYILYKQLILGVPVGNNPMSNLGLGIFSIFVVCFIGLFFVMGLNTEIDNEAIHIRFVPFTSKHILWQDVQSVEVITYDFVGGWGIRLGTKYGTVYNIRGYKGLALQLKSGKKIMIGTQNEEELIRVLVQNDFISK